MLLSVLSTRDRQPEIMDQAGLDVAEHRKALAALRRINWLSRSAGTLWRPIARLANKRPNDCLRVLDVATGGADVLIALARRAARAGLAIQYAGADISATALDCARAAASDAGLAIDFLQLDALHDPLPTGFDVIISSLFLHHLETEQASALLQRMGQAAGAMVLINDLTRSRIGYGLAWLVTRLLTTSYVVHVDGPLSVRAAFTISEARKLAQEAGLAGATVSWRYPWRFLLEWRKRL